MASNNDTPAVGIDHMTRRPANFDEVEGDSGSDDDKILTDDDVDIEVEREIDHGDMVSGEVNITIDWPDEVDGFDFDVHDDGAIVQYWRTKDHELWGDDE